jgi:outer membrane protein assembly factor BamE (lipoprotein component of BamABCDE complex)
MKKIDVLSLMGSPSTTSDSNGHKFYYISNKFYKYAFLTPREIERTIVVIGFGKNDLVTTIEEYALKDGKVVDYKSERTVPGGTQATILQDLFDSSGRYTSSEAIAGSIF